MNTTHRKWKRPFARVAVFRFLFTLAATAALNSSAHSQNQNGNSAGNIYSWTAVAGILNWNSANWNPAAGVYGPWGSLVTAELLSTLTAAEIVTITNPIALNELDIGGSAAFSFDLTGAANSLTFSSNFSNVAPLIFMPSSAGGAQVISAPVNLNNSLTITNNSSANLLTLNGGITAASTAAGITTNGAGSVLISTAALAITPGAGNNFTIANSGTGVLEISGGITGTVNLILNNNSTTAGGITLSGTSVNNAGTITNSGAGSGGVTINAVIGTNVTGLFQNSATSALTLGAQNTFANGLTILSGTVIVNVSNGTSGNDNGAAGPAATPINLGAPGGSNSASLLNNGFTVSNGINLGTTTGTLTIGGNVGGGAAVFSGPINLGANNLTIAGAGGSVTVSGGIMGTGNLTITSAAPNATITLSGANGSFVGTVTILSGTLTASTSANALGAGTVILGNTGGNAAATLLVMNTNGLTIANAISLATGVTGTLTVGNTGTAISTTFSGGVTGTNNLTINSNATTGTITFSTNSINNAGTITNIGAGSGGTTIASVIGSFVTGVIQNSATAGLTLSGANSSFAGTVTILSGTITASTSAGALGAGAGTLTLGNTSGSAAATFVDAVGSAYSNPIVLATGATGTLTLGNSAGVATTFSGGVTGTNNLTINAGGTITFSNPINNSGTVTNTGTGSGATSINGGIGPNVTQIIENSTTASLTIGAGGLTVAASGTTLINSAGTLSVTGNVGGTGALTLQNNSSTANGIALSGASVNNTGAVTVSGAGSGGVLISAVIGANVTAVTLNNASTLTLAGANAYIGATTVNAGTLSLTGSIASNSTLVVGGGTFSYAPTSAPSTQTMNGLTVNIGASTINASGGNTLALGALTARNAGGTVNFNSTASGTITTAAGTTNNILGPWATYGSGASLAYATVSGGSIVPYAYTGGGDSSITTPTAITDTTGTINYTLSGATGGTAGAAASIDTLQFTGSALTITPGAGGLTLNGLMNAGASTLTIAGSSAAPIIIGAGTAPYANELVITGSQAITISGVIQNNGSNASTVTYSGSGTLTLSGANTYSGGLIINSGTVIAGVANSGATSGAAGPSTGAITLGATGGSSAASLLAGSFIVSNPVNLGGTSGALTIGNNGTSTAPNFSGPIALNGNNLTFSSSGTGTTTVSGGITGTGNITVSNATTTDPTTFSLNPVNNSGTITNSSAGTGTVLISGGVGSNVTAITESSTTSALTISGGLVVNSGGTNLANVFGTAKVFTVSGGVTGTGNLVINNNSATNAAITFTLASINNAGTITNSGTGAGSVTITAAVGSNVTGIIESTTTSAFTISGQLTVNSGGTTLTNALGTAKLTLSAGVTGTGNLVLDNNSATAAGVTLTTISVNNAGTISANGSGAGTVTITGGVGSSVTGITNNGASPLSITNNPWVVGANGFPLINNGSGLLTISGGVTNTNNYNIVIGGSGAGGVTFATTALSYTGAASIINNTMGTGVVSINATTLTTGSPAYTYEIDNNSNVTTKLAGIITANNNNVTFGGSGSGGISDNPGGITWNAGGVTLTNNASGNVNAGPLMLGGNTTITNNGAGALTGGAVTAGSATLLTLNTARAAAMLSVGAITTSGAFTITITNNSTTTTQSGLYTLGGNLTINNNTGQEYNATGTSLLNGYNITSSGTGAGQVVFNGMTLGGTGTVTITNSSPGNLSLGGPNTGGASELNLIGTNTGTITTGAIVFFNVSSSTIVSDALATTSMSGLTLLGETTITNNGSGLLTQTGASVTSGATSMLIDGTGTGGIKFATGGTAFNAIGGLTVTVNTRQPVSLGAMALAGGDLTIQNSGSGPVTAGAITANGFNITFSNSANGVLTCSGTIATGGAITLTNSGAGLVTLSAVSNGSNLLTFDSIGGGNTIISGAIGSGGNLGGLTVETSGPGGTLILTGANAYAFPTTINSLATLQLGNNGTAGVFEDSTAITNSGTLVFALTTAYSPGFFTGIAGAGQLIQNGAGGNLTLNSTNTYTGATIVLAGTLTGEGFFTTGTGSSFGLNSALTISGGTLYFSGNVANSTYTTTAALTVGPAGGTLVVDDTITSITPANQTTFTVGSLARAGAGTLIITPQQGSLNMNEIVTFTSLPTVTNGIVAPWTVVQNSGAVSTADFVSLSGNNVVAATYVTGDITAQANSVVFEATSGGNNIVTNAGASVFALKVDSGVNVTDSGGGNSTLTVGNGSGQAGLILNGGSISTAYLNFGAAEGVVYTSSAGGTISSIIQGTTGSGNPGLTTFGPGTLVLSGSNTYTGATTINGGVLSVSSLANGGVASGIGMSASAAANLVLGGGTLLYTGPAASTDRLFTLTANSTISASGSGNLIFSNPGAIVFSGMNLFLTLGGADPATLDPIIGNPTGSTTGVNKAGSGTWQLNATNTYTGATTILGGTLVGYGALTTSSGSSFGLDSAITLNGGALYFQGSSLAATSYSTYGALTVGAAGGILAVDSTSGHQTTTFSAGSLVRTGAGTLVITPQQSSLTVNELVQFTVTQPTITNGIIAPWTVVQNSGTDSTGNFAWVSSGISYGVSAFSAYISGNINVQPSTVVFEAASGGTNGVTGSATVYALKVDNGVNVTDNSGGNGSTLTVGNGTGQAGVILNGGTISTTNLNFGAAEGVVYTSSVGGTISAVIQGSSGGRGLTTFGPGTLLLTSAGNTYTGTTTINGGILAVNNSGGSGTGSGGVVVNSTGTLAGTGSVTTTGNVTVNAGGAIRGGVNDGMNNQGTLTIIYGSAIFSGGVILNSGATLLTQVSGNGTNTPNASLINLTGTLTTLNLNPGGGTFNINLVNNGPNDVPLAGGQTYTITLATVAASGNIQLNGTAQGPSTIIPTTDYTLSTTGLGSSVSSYNLMVDSSGQDLILIVTIATPEPHHILLIGVAALLIGLAIRRRLAWGATGS